MIIHAIEITSELMEFPSFEEFNKWKSGFEEETLATFIKNSSARVRKEGTILEYICHRSGSYKTKENGERSLKTQGSRKIDGFCPAMVKVVIDPEGKCQAEVTRTHVGPE